MVSHLHKWLCVLTVTGYADDKGEGRDNTPCCDRAEASAPSGSAHREPDPDFPNSK